MTQQRRRMAVRVLLTVGAPLVVAVLGVSLGLAGGSAQADNGQSIILGTFCSGSWTNCATSETEVTNTASGVAFLGDATDGAAGLAGQNRSSASSVGGETAGVYGNGVGPGDDGVYGNRQANGVKGETA